MNIIKQIKSYSIDPNYLVLVCFTAILSSCESPASKEHQGLTIEDPIEVIASKEREGINSEDTSHYYVYDSLLTLERYRMGRFNTVEPAVISPFGYLFRAKDTSSVCIDTLLFNTPIIPIRDMGIDDWTAILYKNDTAFIRTSKLSLYTFPSKDKCFKYFLQNQNQTTLVLKWDLKKESIVDSFQIKAYTVQEVKVYNVEHWDNTNILFSINNFGECCGCSNHQLYIIDANNKIDSLFLTNQWGDADDSFVEESRRDLWIPFLPQKRNVRYKALHTYSEPSLGKNSSSQKNYKIDTLKFIEREYTWSGFELIEVFKTTKR